MGNKIYIEPHVPKKWKKYELEYHYLDTTYKIKVNLNTQDNSITMDGEKIDKKYFTIKNDKRSYMQ